MELAGPAKLDLPDLRLVTMGECRAVSLTHGTCVDTRTKISSRTSAPDESRPESRDDWRRTHGPRQMQETYGAVVWEVLSGYSSE